MTLFHLKMPKFEKPCLLISLPKIQDIFLVNKNLTNVIERAKNTQSSPIYQRLVNSGFPEVVAFPTKITCPKLVIECTNHYDPSTRCIKKISGEVIVKINRTSVYLAFRIPHKEPYEPWTFEEEECLYVKRKINYDNKVAYS